MIRTIELRNRAEEAKVEAAEQGLQLALTILRLWETVCRIRARCASDQKHREFEWMVRKKLGEAIAQVSRLDLTPEQGERFTRAFRDLTAGLPIPHQAKVINIRQTA